MIHVRVHLHSKPSPGSTFYRGHVDVTIDDISDLASASRRAIVQLATSTFRDRSPASWTVDRVEVRA